MPLLFTTLILPPTALDMTPAWTAATHRGDDCNREGKEGETENRDGQERTSAAAEELLAPTGAVLVYWITTLFREPKDFATQSRLHLQPVEIKSAESACRHRSAEDGERLRCR